MAVDLSHVHLRGKRLPISVSTSSITKDDSKSRNDPTGEALLRGVYYDTRQEEFLPLIPISPITVKAHEVARALYDCKKRLKMNDGQVTDLSIVRKYVEDVRLVSLKLKALNALALDVQALSLHQMDPASVAIALKHEWCILWENVSVETIGHSESELQRNNTEISIKRILDFRRYLTDVFFHLVMLPTVVEESNPLEYTQRLCLQTLGDIARHALYEEQDLSTFQVIVELINNEQSSFQFMGGLPEKIRNLLELFDDSLPTAVYHHHRKMVPHINVIFTAWDIWAQFGTGKDTEGLDIQAGLTDQGRSLLEKTVELFLDNKIKPSGLSSANPLSKETHWILTRVFRHREFKHLWKYKTSKECYADIVAQTAYPIFGIPIVDTGSSSTRQQTKNVKQAIAAAANLSSAPHASSPLKEEVDELAGQSLQEDDTNEEKTVEELEKELEDLDEQVQAAEALKYVPDESVNEEEYPRSATAPPPFTEDNDDSLENESTKLDEKDDASLDDTHESQHPPISENVSDLSEDAGLPSFRQDSDEHDGDSSLPVANTTERVENQEISNEFAEETPAYTAEGYTTEIVPKDDIPSDKEDILSDETGVDNTKEELPPVLSKEPSADSINTDDVVYHESNDVETSQIPVDEGAANVDEQPEERIESSVETSQTHVDEVVDMVDVQLEDRIAKDVSDEAPPVGGDSAESMDEKREEEPVTRDTSASVDAGIASGSASNEALNGATQDGGVEGSNDVVAGIESEEVVAEGNAPLTKTDSTESVDGAHGGNGGNGGGKPARGKGGGKKRGRKRR